MRLRMSPALLRLLALSIAPLSFLVAARVGDRGQNLWSVWLLEHAERLTQARALPTQEAHALLAQAPVLFPLPSAIVSIVAPGREAGALELFGLLSAVACVAWVGVAASRVAGTFAGVIAGFALLCCPLFWSAATVASPTVFSAAAFAAFVSMSAPGSDRGLARSVGLAGALFAALYSGLVGWLWLAPAFILLFVRSEDGWGRIVVGPVAWHRLLVLPVAIGGGLLLPGLPGAGLDGLGILLRAWLVVPSEPVLYFGQIYADARLPILAPWVLLAARTPLAVLLLAGYGAWFGRRRPGTHSIVWFGVLSISASWIFVTPYVGGHDLLAISCVPLSVLAGTGGSRWARKVADGLRHVGRGSRPRTGRIVVAAALGISWIQPVRSAPHWEASWSGLLGGTEGASARGFSRAWRLPIPPQILDGTSARSDGHLYVWAPVNAWELRPVLERMARQGAIRPVRFVGLDDADYVVLKWEDSAAELYALLPVLLEVRRTGRMLRSYEVGRVPLLEVLDVRR
jgi:hypothetical protein